MSFQAKLLVFIGLAFLACKIYKCDAQDSLQKPLDFPSSSSFQSKQQSNTPILSVNKATNFGNIEFSLKYESDNNEPYSNKPLTGFTSRNDYGVTPEISLFSSESPSSANLAVNSNVKSVRFDRYKNTIPAIYRLTLKGYSVMEHSNNKTDVWTLNKVKNKAYRKPEIMFSVTKRF